VPIQPLDLIRNFCIVAHIDHGKSTLADRFLDLTHAVAARQMREQYLDRMDLERERGITIKAQAVRLRYTPAAAAGEFELNLIDTPGHVDFSYEVSRSLAACEGAILLVDAAQGIEAQTLANFHLARDAGLVIVPAVNKIDLPAADPDETVRELAELLGCPEADVLRVSAKSGAGVKELLEAVIARVPPPSGDRSAPLRALIFDSTYDPYRGVIAYLRVVDGRLVGRERIRYLSTGHGNEAEEVGVFAPDPIPVDELVAGDVGYLVTGVKDVRQAQVGDTITADDRPATEPLHGYREPKPMVWSGLYPAEGGDYSLMRDALDKLRLSDASLVYEPESSLALGFGFRCGFLGLLHMEIVKERLEREFGLELIATAPNVEVRVVRAGGEVTTVHNPSEMPVPGTYEFVEEPFVLATVISPSAYLGPVMELCQARRGTMEDMRYLSPERAELHYLLPLGEIIFDFFDQLKSRTRGYASLDYEHWGYEQSDLVRVDILLQGEPVDAFSSIVPRERAYQYGRAMTERLRELIPRQMFEVAIQASIGSRVIARESVRAKRKDVLAKCYGGDITRKRKLLEKQKEGKKRMRRVGRVDVPQEAFIAALRVETSSSSSAKEAKK
jgi:GTP-binding protein LepA